MKIFSDPLRSFSNYTVLKIQDLKKGGGPQITLLIFVNLNKLGNDNVRFVAVRAMSTSNGNQTCSGSHC